MTTTEMSNPVNEYYSLPDLEDPEPGHWMPVVMPDVVPGYTISSTGQVKSPSGALLKGSLTGKQIWVGLKLTTTGKQRHHRLDRLVLLTFRGEPEQDDLVPRHQDGNTSNNAVDNLIWADKELPGARPLNPPKKSRTIPRRNKTTEAAVTAAPRKPRRKVADDDVEVTRVYSYGDVTLTVGLDGETTVAVTKQPKIRLTSEQFSALMKVGVRVREMNLVMGVK